MNEFESAKRQPSKQTTKKEGKRLISVWIDSEVYDKITNNNLVMTKAVNCSLKAYIKAYDNICTDKQEQ